MSSSSPAPPPNSLPPSPVDAAPPLRVLVVDDEPDNVDLLVRLLARQGYEVSSAANGHEGLRLARELKPDLVLLDVVMPDLNGREVCRHIKEDAALANVFVALISSVEISADSKVEGLQCGADDYITRPIANRELVARVKVLSRIQRELTKSNPGATRHRPHAGTGRGEC
jgi:DNA-binding response OmpR family regulator